MAATLYPRPVISGRAPYPFLANHTQRIFALLDDARHWTSCGARLAFERFVHVVGEDRLGILRGSWRASAQRITARDIPDIAEALSPSALLSGRPRHLFELRVGDVPGAHSVGFRYREVDPAIEARRGFLAADFSRDLPSRQLRAWFLALIESEPVWFASAGHSATWHDKLRASSLPIVWGWCKRHLALEPRDPEMLSWVPSHVIPTVGWLTFLSRALAEQCGITAKDIDAWGGVHSIATWALPSGGILIQAGVEPELDDANFMTYPSALARVSVALHPWTTWERRDELGLRSMEPRLPRAWHERFVDPQEWSA